MLIPFCACFLFCSSGKPKGIVASPTAEVLKQAVTADTTMTARMESYKRLSRN